MKNLITKSFGILKNNLLFMQPLLLYLLMVMLALPYILSKNIFIVPKTALALSMFLLTIATISGWFFINKAGVLDYNEDDSQEEVANKAIKNFKLFFTGVGEYFVTILSGVICFAIIYFFLFFLTVKFCLYTAGEPVIASKLNEFASLKTVNEFSALLNTFSVKDILIFKYWVAILTLAGILYNFTGILYFSVIFSENVNALKAIGRTFLFLIKNLGSCIFIILFMFFIYIIGSILTMIFGTNSLAFAILIILATLYFNYYVILVLCFYNERTKNNSDNRTECIGENSPCD